MVDTEPTGDDKDHVTAVLDVPLTVALNCCVPPGPRVTLDGDIDTVIGEVGAVALLNTTSTQ